MIVLVGVAVVMGAVLAGFMMSGGQLGALMHPSELLTIGGAAMGAMIMMSPISVLKNLGIALIGTLKGSQYDKATYRELFKLMYDLLRIARRDGARELLKSFEIFFKAHLSARRRIRRQTKRRRRAPPAR
jgi:chemotaxis protein MotA